MSTSAKLPLRVKSGYGAAETGISAAEFLLQVALLEFYITAVGLNAGLAALALAIGTLWDGISDPLMGTIIDRTRLRAGRFLPFIALGGVLLAIALLVVFLPPQLDSQLAKFGYMLGACLLINTATTIISVPHLALGAALSQDRHERTHLVGWRLVFGNLGFLLGVLLPVIVAKSLMADVETSEGLLSSRGGTAVVLAAVTIIGAAITCFALRNRQPNYDAIPSQSGFWKNIFSLLRNHVFRPLLASFMLMGIARTINASVALFYYKLALDLSEEQVFVNVLVVFIFSILLSIPFWAWLSRKIGKRGPALFGLSTLGVLGAIVYLIFPSGELLGPVVMAVIGGILVGTVILFESLVADVVDYDELKTGRRREGLYFGFWKMATKLSRALGLGLTALLLSLIGFEEGAITQSEDTLTGLRWIFGPGVGGFFLLAAIAFYLMPLTDSRHVRVQALLNRRKEFRAWRLINTKS